jgi:hypothetical protein
MPRYSELLARWKQSERGTGLRTQRAIQLSFLLCFLIFTRVPRGDAQAATSQFPLQAVASPETSVMAANAREGLINLDVAATDREGRPFSGLTAKDFTLLDNGVPQKIVSFTASNEAIDDTERLTEVVLVLDEVNLSPTQFEVVKAESIKYLRQNGGHLAQPASVYWFTRLGLYASAQPTTDGNALAEDVAHHPPRVLWELPPNRMERAAGWPSWARRVAVPRHQRSVRQRAQSSKRRESSNLNWSNHGLCAILNSLHSADHVELISAC